MHAFGSSRNTPAASIKEGQSAAKLRGIRNGGNCVVSTSCRDKLTK
jgi:hypothetical protein